MGPLCRGAAEALEASRNALLLLIRAVSEWAYRLYETGRSKSRHDQRQDVRRCQEEHLELK